MRSGPLVAKKSHPARNREGKTPPPPRLTASSPPYWRGDAGVCHSAWMADISLEFLAEQQRRILDELQAHRDEQKAMRSELRRNTELVLGLNRTLEHQREDLIAMLKAEIGGLFLNLESQLERRIIAELRGRSELSPEGS